MESNHYHKIRSFVFYSLNYTAMNQCLFCNKETINPRFCSHSCSAKLNNKLYPKRKPTKFCKTCGKNINCNSWYCKECKPKAVEERTLQEVIYTNHHKSSAFALVRALARTVAKSLGYKSCVNCKYEKHYEVCHIKAIGDFPLTAKLIEINSPDNLLCLCPNCHWEFDNGLLKL